MPGVQSLGIDIAAGGGGGVGRDAKHQVREMGRKAGKRG
jgi:hypothetical protein